MATASARLIQHQSKFIKRLLGGDKNFAHLLETYLQVAASTSGITQEDIASTLGWSESEAKALLTDASIFGINDDGLVVLAPLGEAILGGCLGIPWAASPSGLFTDEEEALWEELFLKLDKVKSGVEGLSVGQMLWEHFRLSIKSKYFVLTSAEQSLAEAIQAVLGKYVLGEHRYVRDLVIKSRALEQFRVVANIANSIHLEIGPSRVWFEVEGCESIASSAKATIEAFDTALQVSPYALAVFVSLAEKPMSSSALAASLDCSLEDIDVAASSLGQNVTGSAKKYSLSAAGQLLFTRHFLLRSDFSGVATFFYASSAEQRAWFRAEQVLLNAQVGPSGERLKDIAPKRRYYTDSRYLEDGVTIIKDLLSSLGLAENWNAESASSIKDVRVLLGKIPALKEFRTGITYAKQHKP